MEILKSFTHIAEQRKFIFKEKGSEFIGLAFYAETEEEFHIILNNVKKEYYSATHHCYCTKLINGYLKYSDDGEPNGTAGVRILKAIEHYDLNNILVIVVRYFGGVKLGTGPLGKAYYTAAEEVLKSCKRISKAAFRKLIISTNHSFVSLVHRLVNNTGAKILETKYDEDIQFTCAIPVDKVDEFREQSIEQSNANIDIEIHDEIIFF